MSIRNEEPLGSVISLGAGTQSSALLLMAADDKLPEGHIRPELAVFADTGGEPTPVYDWLEYLTREAEAAGIEVQIVTHVNEVELADEAAKRIPAHILNDDGSTGMIARYCTRDWKIRPVQKAAFKYMQSKGGNRKRDHIEMLFGMSMDETHRMKTSDAKFIKNRYPLIDLGWYRQDTIDYIEERTGKTPPRSACTYCPYRSHKEWAWLRNNDPEGWEQAIEVDRSLRDTDLLEELDVDYTGKLFLHRSHVPLEEAILIPEDAGQLGLFGDEEATGFGNECSAGCGL